MEPMNSHNSLFSKTRFNSIIGLNLPLIMLLLTMNTYSQKKGTTISLFDGTSLEGWKTVKEENKGFWSVKDSIIVGGDRKRKIPENTFLYALKSFENFEFRCLFRLTGESESGFINSGIQYRSVIEREKMIGYQADIGEGFWGDIYDEHRRGELMDGDLSTLRYILNRNGWNSYIIRVKGNKHELYINGVKTGEYIEEDEGIPSKGVIGIQLHSGGKAQIEVRDITVTLL